MVESYACLFLGEDELVKKNKIDSIKERYLDKDFKDIDFEIIYSDDKQLTPPKFDEALSYLPSSPSKKRVILIKRIESLKKDIRDILVKHLKNPSRSVLLLLDSSRLEAGDPFIRVLEPFVKKFNFKREKKLNVFDLTRAIVSRKTTYALRVLNILLSNREKPQSILGALFWQWDNMKGRLSLDKFRQGLKLLLDTDIKIKRGKLKEELALELVVIRLSYLA